MHHRHHAVYINQDPLQGALSTEVHVLTIYNSLHACYRSHCSGACMCKSNLPLGAILYNLYSESVTCIYNVNTSYFLLRHGVTCTFSQQFRSIDNSRCFVGKFVENNESLLSHRRKQPLKKFPFILRFVAAFSICRATTLL